MARVWHPDRVLMSFSVISHPICLAGYAYGVARMELVG
jgi:hypothetical protein